MRTLKSALAMMTLLANNGCVSTTHYPSGWAPHLTSAEWCERPQGSFANVDARTTMARSDGEPGLLLTEVFFGNALTGFDVSHISFQASDGQVKITPWVGQQPLKEHKLIKLGRNVCKGGMLRVKSDLAMQPGAAFAGLLWTGGIVIPMATGVSYEIAPTAEGDLSVHATVRTSGTMFVFFPMRTRDLDEWFLYRNSESYDD